MDLIFFDFPWFVVFLASRSNASFPGFLLVPQLLSAQAGRLNIHVHPTDYDNQWSQDRKFWLKDYEFWSRQVAEDVVVGLFLCVWVLSNLANLWLINPLYIGSTPPSNSHHQDYEPFLVGDSQPKPSFATIASWEGATSNLYSTEPLKKFGVLLVFCESLKLWSTDQVPGT